MNTVLQLIGGLLLAERIWKWALVVRFFRQAIPPAQTMPRLVSILQPILSGDPTLPVCLERNLQAASTYRREWIWLVDTDDLAAQAICQTLVDRYPQCAIRLVLLSPPAARENPKMIKLIAGAEMAQGDVLCVLDDDTQLPDGGLEQCLPFLDQPGIGLAFGLPYYLNFATVWSALVAYFVNSNSLLTYIPYTVLAEPFTINGMFYVVRRSVFDAIGGFAGLEHTLADDFAVAQRLRHHGYRLAQTPLRHGISTHVSGPRHYLSLLQRWFIFPRESLLRHLGWREQLIIYGLGLFAACAPLVLLGWSLASRSWLAGAMLLAYVALTLVCFAHFNRAYLRDAAPWRFVWCVPLIQLVFPIQLIIALCSPQRIVWRGHVMQAERGGGFRFVRRRDEDEL